ncbi:hypothetical protein [Chryseobacterium sp. SIMBA_028]|uniref:hypothetical protein n=1 Tax=Chryseobacterium sp. SIMBA_028 TaxID=3085771 RepID=UPI00397B4D91
MKELPRKTTGNILNVEHNTHLKNEKDQKFGTRDYHNRCCTKEAFYFVQTGIQRQTTAIFDF